MTQAYLTSFYRSDVTSSCIIFQDVGEFLVHVRDADVAHPDGGGRGAQQRLGDGTDHRDDERRARALQRLVHRTPQLSDRAPVRFLRY